jgi:hypothetical protein
MLKPSIPFIFHVIILNYFLEKGGRGFFISRGLHVKYMSRSSTWGKAGRTT